MGWYIGVLKKYAVFTGRARRTEYWMFALFNFIIGIVLGLLAMIPTIGIVFTVLSTIYSLGVLVPGIAVGVRRLHDTNRSGLLLLLSLIPIAGIIIILVFTLQQGTSGDNQYGPDPKA